MTKNDYKLLFKRLLFSFLFFFLFRAIFYFYNLNYFESFPLAETLYAFFYGLRFDLATVLIVNLFFILFSLIPIRPLWYQKFLKIIFLVMNLIFLAFVIVDLEFFSFLGRKMTIGVFDMGADITGQSLQLIFNYWYLTVLFFLCAYLLYRFYPKRLQNYSLMPGRNNIAWYKCIIIGFFIFIFTGIGIRGGVQLRSISPKEAFVHEHYELGNLTLNAAYTIARSLGKKSLNKEKFFKSDQKAKEIIQNVRSFKSNYRKEIRKDNIVILIMESFSQEYFDKGLMPFLKELSTKALSFERNLANGRRSLEALPSIMTGFPSLVGKPLYQSSYQANKYIALPKILKEHGYQTGFFHGGKKGTMDFDAYCYSIGFDQYYSKEEYPNQDHFDGHWGIYDHYFFRFFIDELNSFKQPFLAGFFSLSSHQPYSIPKEFQEKFPKGTLDIHESIGYADHSLKLFFDLAKKQDWYKNTLFIITADHSQKLETKKFNNPLGRYRVPLIFFHPNENLSLIDDTRITQHADIMPSILDFLGIKQKHKLLFGSSVFSNQDARAINFLSGNYFYVKAPYLLRFDKNQSKLFIFDDDLGQLKGTKDQKNSQLLLQELKAYIQYTNNGLRSNNIYDF